MLQLGLAGGFDIGNIISPLGAELLLREAVSSSRYQTGIWKQNDIHQ